MIIKHKIKHKICASMQWPKEYLNTSKCIFIKYQISNLEIKVESILLLRRKTAKAHISTLNTNKHKINT